MAIEAEYYTPAGCVDLPYIYVYDATLLTDGATVLNQLKQIEYDSDFVLRAILGAPYVVNPAIGSGGGFKLYNYSGSAAFDNFLQAPANQIAIMPEKIYPKSTALKFDLQNVLRKNSICAATQTIFFPQLAFQGVKRYRPGTPGYPPGAPAAADTKDPTTFIRSPWTYTFNLTLDWFAWVTAGNPSQNKTFTIDVTDYDFELHYISAVNTATGLPVTADIMQFQMFDSTGKRPLSSVPVNFTYINNNNPNFNSPVFPVPPLLYPVWTQLKFVIQSLVCNSDGSSPYHLQIQFVGAQRIPKVKAMGAGA